MTIQNFTGPCVIVEKCIYKPEWSAWEKLIIVHAGDIAGVSDTFWTLSSYDTSALALAANPEFTAIENYEAALAQNGQLEMGRPV